MESTLSPVGLAAMFGVMAVLAAVPSVSVLAVSARAARFGFLHGGLTAAGIVTGDIIFILLAIFGLVLLVETLGGLFFLVKYIAGAYLIWFGISLWRARTGQRTAEGGGEEASHLSSFMTGLLITLADQKAVLFYLGFFPAFLDPAALTTFDVVTVILVTIVAVGSVKLVYAFAGNRAGLLVGGRAGEALNVLAAGIMMIAGVYLIVRS